MQQRSPSPEAPPEPKEYQQEEANPDLAKYLNRNYWEQRKVSDSPMASPSAPSPMPTPQPQQLLPMQHKPADEVQIDDFAANMRTQVEIFVNRMKSNSSRGRSISNDSSVQTLFMTLTSLHSQQLSYIKEMDDKRMWYEQLQDKLAQIKDSRAALDVLRQEHVEKLRRVAEEQERQRQIQMAQKLEIMRKKKQEYLQYQRQLALQRIQEQEREMQLRQEQQKAQYRMGQSAFPFMPSGAAAVTGAHGSPSHVYNPYAYNPNSPGPMSGQFNAQGQMGGPQTMPGMYTQNMQPALPPNQHPAMMMLGQMPTGMMQPLPNGAMMQGGGIAPQMADNDMSNYQVNALQQAPQQHQQPQPQQQQQQQQKQPPPPQLTHVMLQHQNVMQNQPTLPTPPAAQMSTVEVANGAPPTHQQLPTIAAANAQMQAVAAAPPPPQAEPEPAVGVAAAVPLEPATAELISFD